MSNRWPEITDAASLDAWIRAKGFDPDECADWTYAEDGPPPWAEWDFDADKMGFTAHWPLINTERRVMGVITDMETDDE